MRDGITIMDCDRHCLEPATLWDDYLEPEFQHHGVQSGWYGFVTLIRSHPPRAATPFDSGGTGFRHHDQVIALDASNVQSGVSAARSEANRYMSMGMATHPGWRHTYKNALARRFDNVSYLADMDREGIDVGVLFTSIGLYATYRDEMDPDLAAAMCRAYNNWLHEYCSIDPDRMKGVCLLPVQDVRAAVQELRRAVGELGMIGVFWRPNPIAGRAIDDREWDDLFAACQELGVPLCVHEGQQEDLPYFTRGRTSSRFTRHATCHPQEQMGAFLAMASGGVLDRFPGLRVAYLESGSGWLPYWLERLDEMFANPLLRDGYGGALRPSEYFARGQCYISCEAEEETISMLGRLVGEDCLMWASDYPHPDNIVFFPHTVAGLFEQELPAEFRRKILWDNPRRFYGLPI